ncbi:hypothetical protein UlMin_018657 [Ulmus minor]
MIINSKIGRIVVGNLLIPLYIFYTLITGPTLSFSNKTDNKILKVGEELWKETLPLQMGSRLYQLQGLKLHKGMNFSLQLRIGNLNSALRVNRRLLDTEKLIFKTENIDISNQVRISIFKTAQHPSNKKNYIFVPFNYQNSFFFSDSYIFLPIFLSSKQKNYIFVPSNYQNF